MAVSLIARQACPLLQGEGRLQVGARVDIRSRYERTIGLTVFAQLLNYQNNYIARISNMHKFVLLW